jgi:hypothetical protein
MEIIDSFLLSQDGFRSYLFRGFVYPSFRWLVISACILDVDESKQVDWASTVKLLSDSSSHWVPSAQYELWLKKSSMDSESEISEEGELEATDEAIVGDQGCT